MLIHEKSNERSCSWPNRGTCLFRLCQMAICGLHVFHATTKLLRVQERQQVEQLADVVLSAARRCVSIIVSSSCSMLLFSRLDIRTASTKHTCSGVPESATLATELMDASSTNSLH